MDAAVHIADMEWPRFRRSDYFRFRNRQRPTYRNQLKEMRRERTKPKLVSLADLQVALISPPLA